MLYGIVPSEEAIFTVHPHPEGRVLPLGWARSSGRVRSYKRGILAFSRKFKEEREMAQEVITKIENMMRQLNELRGHL